MLAVATGGLLVNILGLLILGRGNGNLNLRGAWLHVLSDALGSVGAMVSGTLVHFYGWHWADPIASLLICILVLYAAWSLLRQATGVLMQAVPAGLDVGDLRNQLLSTTGVVDVHDLHLWSITDEDPIVSAHIDIAPDIDRRKLVNELHSVLETEFGIHHTTLQLDCPEQCSPCGGAERHP